MLRRRLGARGRLAAQAAEDAHGAGGIPVVMSSRYGDAVRSLGLLEQHALGHGMSPTDFALSVHNAIGAIYSIANADTSNYTAIAAGAQSATAGLAEAVGLLHDGAPEVLLVSYDGTLPGKHADFLDEPPTSYAWAWRIALPRPHAPRFRFRSESLADAEAQSHEDSVLPLGLDALAFVLSGDASRTRTGHGTRWTWSRSDA